MLGKLIPKLISRVNKIAVQPTFDYPNKHLHIPTVLPTRIHFLFQSHKGYILSWCFPWYVRSNINFSFLFKSMFNMEAFDISLQPSHLLSQILIISWCITFCFKIGFVKKQRWESIYIKYWFFKKTSLSHSCPFSLPLHRNWEETLVKRLKAFKKVLLNFLFNLDLFTFLSYIIIVRFS